MAFEYEDTISTEPGQIVLFENQYMLGKTVLLSNLELEFPLSRLWGVYVVQIYVPGIISDFATIFTKQLYVGIEMIFPPFPNLADLNVRTGIYAPYPSFVTDVELYLE